MGENLPLCICTPYFIFNLIFLSSLVPRNLLRLSYPELKDMKVARAMIICFINTKN